MKTNKIEKSIFQKKGWVIIIAVFCSFLWGSAFPALKITYQEMNMAGDDYFSKILIAGIRFTIAGILIWIYAFITMKDKIKIKRKSDFKKLILLGLIQTTLNYFFFYTGLSNTTAAKGSIINSLSNFLIIILAHFLIKNDQLTMKKIYGIVFGIIGVVVVNFDSNLNSQFLLTGEGFMFFSVFTTVTASFMVKSYSRTIHPVILSSYQLMIGGVVMLLISFGGSYDTLKVTPLAMGLLFYTAILSALAFTLWYSLLKYNKPGEITMFRFLIPVTGSLLSAAFLGEKITLNVTISLVAIVIGIILVNYEPRSGQEKKMIDSQP
ncbi:MAG: DMT family transporter [Clostridium sp.]|nr:DMT family transporter [Clostridium sp.]